MLIYFAIAIHLECRVLVVKHLLVQYSLKVYLFLFISNLLFVLLFGSRTYSLPSVSFAGMEKKTFSCILFVFIERQYLEMSAASIWRYMCLHPQRDIQRTFVQHCIIPVLHSFCSNTVAVISFDIIRTLSHFQQQSLTVWLFADEQFLTTRVV